MEGSAIDRARPAREQLIAVLQARYVWWPLQQSGDDRARRILAQIMNLGTYDDIRAVEAVFERRELADVLVHAQPGWFSPRSWSFWRGRLSLSSDGAVPANPPRRSFDAKVVPTEA